MTHDSNGLPVVTGEVLQAVSEHELHFAEQVMTLPPEDIMRICPPGTGEDYKQAIGFDIQKFMAEQPKLFLYINSLSGVIRHVALQGQIDLGEFMRVSFSRMYRYFALAEENARKG